LRGHSSMKRIALTLSFALAVGAAACDSGDASTFDAGVTADAGATADASTTPDVGASGPDPVAGKAVFTTNGCGGCHGADGNMVPPGGTEAFTSATVQARTDQDLANAIKRGKGAMPSYGNLADRQIADVVAYIRQLASMSPTCATSPNSCGQTIGGARCTLANGGTCATGACNANGNCASPQACATAANSCGQTIGGTRCTSVNGGTCATGTCSVNGNCLSGPRACSPGCNSQKPCSSGQSCRMLSATQGICLPSSSFCQDVSTCSAGTNAACRDGLCSPYPDCASDANCPAGQVCTNGACSPGCNAQKPCSSGQSCRMLSATQGICLPSSLFCQDVSTCSAGNNAACRDGLCSPYPSCSSDASCPAGQLCTNGSCSPGCNAQKPCSSAQACRMLSATQGICLPSSSFCQDVSTCSAGNNAACRDGLCSPYPPCSSDDNCPAGQVCL
jgi:Cys-rich repeat protein